MSTLCVMPRQCTPYHTYRLKRLMRHLLGALRHAS